MHPNGRVGEAALCVLARRKTEVALPFILLRTNDWVLPIREKAREIVLERISSEHAGDFLDNLPLILRLETCERSEHQWLLDVVSSLLCRIERKAILDDGLHSSDTTVRLGCLRFVVAANAPTAKDALQAATKDRDSMIRLWAVKQLVLRAESGPMSAVHAAFSQDPFMPVRREALNAIVREGGDRVRTTLLAHYSTVIRRYANSGAFTSMVAWMSVNSIVRLSRRRPE